MSDINDGRLAYHDAHALDYFLSGKDADSFSEDTERSDFFSPDFVRSEAFLSTSELLRRENSDCDVIVSDIIQAHLADSQPLYSINHPSRQVLVDLGNRILKMLDIESTIPADGPDPLNFFVVAPYLSTVHALGHNGHGLRLDEIRSSHVWESRREYFREVFKQYQEIGASAIRLQISKHSEIFSYLKRFYFAKHEFRFESSRSLIESLYKTFLGRTPNSVEVLHHLQTLENFGYHALVTTFAGSPEFYSSGGGLALEGRFPNRLSS